MKVSGRVAGVEYAIRDIVAAARRLEDAGRSIDYLNIGDPVQYGFQPPEHVREAHVEAVRGGRNFYSDSEGLPELRAEIAARERSKGLDAAPGGVVVTNGVSEALDMVVSSIVEDGDEVLLPGPYYPPYASYVRLRGGVPVEFAVDAESASPDIDDVRSKITGRTVAICLISPNNPTGAVFGERALGRLVDLAAEHGLYVVCDEIYDEIVFGGRFAGIGRVASDAPVVLLNGFSKVRLMSGWRIGYVAFNEACAALGPLRENLPKLARVRISTNLPVQHAALASLRGPHDYIDRFVSEVRRRRDLAVRRLNSIEGLSCPEPGGAFYAFPRIDDCAARFGSDERFVMGLLEKEGVLAVHGSGFGKKYGSGHFRIVYLPDEGVLDRALLGIERFVAGR